MIDNIIEHISLLTMVQFIFCWFIIDIIHRGMFEILIQIGPIRRKLIIFLYKKTIRAVDMEVVSMGCGKGTFVIDSNGNITKKED